MPESEKYVVAKPFNTVNRRLQVGEVVTEREIVATDTQMLFVDRRKQGFLAGYDSKAAEKAARKAADADAPLMTGSPGPVPPPEDASPAAAPEEPERAEPEMKRPPRR